MNSTPLNYFFSLQETPGYERTTNERRSFGVRYKKGNLVLAFYKTDEALLHPDAHAIYNGSNLLRIELRITKNILRTLNYFSPKMPVAYLYSKFFFNLLAKQWMKHYTAVIKKRHLYEAPTICGWNEFQDYLTTTAVLREGYATVVDLVTKVSIDNKWNSRTTKNVINKISGLRDTAIYSANNKYIAELECKIKETYAYEVAGHFPILQG